MFNRIYLIGGGVLIAGYVIWSALGMELWANRMDSVPRTRVYSSSSRSSRGYYGGGGGFGFGK